MGADLPPLSGYTITTGFKGSNNTVNIIEPEFLESFLAHKKNGCQLDAMTRTEAGNLVNPQQIRKQFTRRLSVLGQRLNSPVWLTPKLEAKGQTTMDDIIFYNELKGDILRKIVEVQKWELADIKLGSDQSKASEREDRLNYYIEFIARFIVNLPMPD